MVDLTPAFVDDAVDWGTGAAEDTVGFAGDRVSDLADGVSGIAGFLAKTAEGAWDLATDPIEAIYAEARRGVRWLRGMLAEVADFAVNPVGDSGSLRTTAGAWTSVADAAGRQRGAIDTGGRSLAAAWEGPNADAYLDAVLDVHGSLGEVERAARDVARLLDRGAETVDDLNGEVQRLVAETAAWIGVSVVVGLITGGGGLAVGGARVARTVQQVRSLVTRARAALVALKVAQVARLQRTAAIGLATLALTRRGQRAVDGAAKAARLGRRVAASKAAIGLGKAGRAVSPVSTRARRIAFTSATASGAISLSLAKDPRDWTAEDVARLVAGGYLTGAAGTRVTAILTRTTGGRLGEVGTAALQGALFGAAGSAGSQALFRDGKVDWETVGLTAATGGFGGGIGRGSVARRLRGTDDALVREQLKARGRLGVEAVGEGVAQRGVRRSGEGGGGSGVSVDRVDRPRIVVPDAPRIVTIRPGDSLWSIAGDRLHDPTEWARIRRANPGLVDPDQIAPGDRVVLP